MMLGIQHLTLFNLIRIVDQIEAQGMQNVVATRCTFASMTPSKSACPPVSRFIASSDITTPSFATSRARK
jgi:hypothetical protein